MTALAITIAIALAVVSPTAIVALVLLARALRDETSARGVAHEDRIMADARAEAAIVARDAHASEAARYKRERDDAREAAAALLGQLGAKAAQDAKQTIDDLNRSDAAGVAVVAAGVFGRDLAAEAAAAAGAPGGGRSGPPEDTMFAADATPTDPIGPRRKR